MGLVRSSCLSFRCEHYNLLYFTSFPGRSLTTTQLVVAPYRFPFLFSDVDAEIVTGCRPSLRGGYEPSHYEGPQQD